MKLSPFVPVASARVRDRAVCRREPRLSSLHISRHPSYLHSLSLSLASSSLHRERNRQKEKAFSSRYHKSFEVLIRSHTRRLFRVWHSPDLGPHVDNHSKTSPWPLSSRCIYLICLTARARSESHGPSTAQMSEEDMDVGTNCIQQFYRTRLVSDLKKYSN